MFENLSKDDALIAGGKGASLGEMTQAGIPVPPGFVVLADTFDSFLAETDLTQEIAAILETVEHDAMHTIEVASEKIQSLILSRTIPEDIRVEIEQQFQVLGAQYVAVRSSATAEDGADHAWAGQLESYLNTTHETLLAHVQKCWASLFTPRAIFYRFEKGLHAHHISVAVVVQTMVNSEKSGIAFSVHPVTEDRNQLIIEAGLGLGEAIVSGAVTPDSYVVSKVPRQIIDVNVNHQNRALYRDDAGGNVWHDLSPDHAATQVLSTDEIQALSDIIVSIEKHYGFPCDIEWAQESGNFYVVQSRPITTLSDHIKDASKQKIEKIFSRDFTLIALEMDYRMENQKTRPWAVGENPFSPYVVFWRNDGTNAIYFNSNGVEWVKGELEARVRENPEFLYSVEENVRAGIHFIRPLYEARQPINRENLIRFVNDFMGAYHWIEAMWWIKSMSEDSLKDVDCSNIIHLREETEMLSSATDIVIRASLEELYPELGSLSSMISWNEFVSNIIPERSELERRNQGFVLINNDIITNKTFDDILNEYHLLDSTEKNTTGDLNILTGQGVNSGIYRGHVVRVMGHNDFEKVKDGNVLISPMTMVDFMPIMQKASAFVTDEGGLLCHAAIVAREMRKPCVIGTKIATQVLNDGDLVEVDADNGKVKIIENRRE